MSTIDTSIQRPYFSKQEYPRVIENGFKEIIKTTSDTQVEELLEEYRTLYDSLPPEIHGEIARNSAAFLNIDLNEEDFNEINRLNNLLDELESQEFQEETIDSQEHPHYRNGSFLKGWTYSPENGANLNDLTEDDLKKTVTFYYMQRGHKRPIVDYDLFKILYTLRTKDDSSSKNINSKVPFLENSDAISKIPIGKPITYNIGSETALTDITTLPPEFIDASSKSAVLNKYKNQEISTPIILAIQQQTYIELEDLYKNDPNRLESLKSITRA